MKENKISRRSLIKTGLGAATIGAVSATGFSLFEAPTPGIASPEVPAKDESLNSNESPARNIEGSDAGTLISRKRPIDYVNVLFGTASLDDPNLIGNAPPAGEELYTGMVSPGAALPFGIDLSPVNKDISLAYPHGNLYGYVYPRRTMVGFSSMVPDMLLMPVVGDWTTPPDRIRYASLYSKESERSVPGHYTVHLADHKIAVDLTATALTGLYQFTFPKTDRATILLDLGPGASSSVEIVDDRTVRGRAEGGKVFFVVEFSPGRARGLYRMMCRA